MINDEQFFAPKNKPQYMFVTPDLSRVAIVERLDEDRLPTYLVLAHTRCLWCQHWCWLGDNSLALIASGGASPMCEDCAETELPESAQLMEVIRDSPAGDVQ